MIGVRKLVSHGRLHVACIAYLQINLKNISLAVLSWQEKAAWELSCLNSPIEV